MASTTAKLTQRHSQASSGMMIRPATTKTAISASTARLGIFIVLRSLHTTQAQIGRHRTRNT